MGSYCVDTVWDASLGARLNHPERSVQASEAAEEPQPNCSFH